MKLNLTKEVKEIMTIINNSGYDCYLVGGAVRDMILNINNKDYDLCTNMPLDELKKKIPNMVIMKENNHRNTGIIRNNYYDYEISSFRGLTIEEDLFKRDFKMNAIAIDIDGNLIDPYNGIEDIYHRKLSLISNDGSAFLMDPLRILRAIRQATKFNFTIDDICLKEMDLKKDLLDDIAPERIFNEFSKILMFDNVSEILLKHKSIFFKIIPELEKCDGFKQYNDYHIYDVLNHILKVVASTPSNLYLRLAALFHDIGKPKRYTKDERGIGHFYGHSKESANIFKKFSIKYKLDNKTRSIVYKLILYHDYSLSIKPNKIYNFYKKFGYENIELLFELKKADIYGQNKKYLDRIDLCNDIMVKYLEVRSIIKNINYDGSKLVKLGISGKLVGIILDDITRLVVNKQLENNELMITNYVKNKYLYD